MSRVITLAVLSDVHYASEAERARGDDFEIRDLPNPIVRLLLKAYRDFIWLRLPLRKNHLLDQFLGQAESVDWAIGNGDYSCDSAFVGVSDPAACQSAGECLARLRDRFGGQFRATIGDHELGKFSFIGTRGGMRLASYERARSELGLDPFWKVNLGRYVLIGVASSLAALPAFDPCTLPAERPEWERLRREHLAEIAAAFAALDPDQRVLLFCHDPTALPFLGREEAVRARLRQIEHTIIGHLHSNLFLWKSRMLAGMPVIPFLGHSARRMSMALREARRWKPFQIRLCPSLAGIELLKDGGFLTIELDPSAHRPARVQLRRLRR